MENSYRPAHFDCTKSISQQYQCKCGNFKTNFAIHLKQHLQESHKTEGKSLEVYNCKCSLETYSRLFFLQHNFLRKCWATKFKSRQPFVGKKIQETHIFPCEQCDYTSKWKRMLAEHILQKHTKLSEIHWHQCEQCPKRYRVKKGLKRHIKDVHTKLIIKCELCNFTTKKQLNFTEHVLRKHPHLSGTQWHQCELCPKKFTVKGDLVKHVRVQHTKQVFKCEYCAFETKTQDCLTIHILRRHTELPEDQWHQCEQCAKRYKLCKDLKQHIKTNHCKEALICNQCGFQTKEKRRLTSHIMRKHATKFEWHQCEQCCEKFKLKADLTRHARVKHLKKTLHCEHCSYQTKIKNDLTEHIMRKHISLSEIKWHKCEQCPKKYKCKTSLQQHVRRKHNTSSKMSKV